MEIRPTSPMVGAEISGVDVRSMSDDDFARIRQAFIDHGAIIIRDQDLTPEDHVDFAQRWGTINVNRFFPTVDGHPNIAEVRKEPDQAANIGGAWHTDHSYDQIPAMGSILYAREVPPIGGDTLFSSMYAAYETLSAGLREVLDGLWAEHSNRHTFGRGTDPNGLYLNPDAATDDALHPVVIQHPLSGRPALYVNFGFTTRIHGWTDMESAALLQFLYRHAARNEFTTRFQWRPGSLAMWDNRAVHHNALNDYHGHRRLMHRITIDGEPIGPARPQPRPEPAAA